MCVAFEVKYYIHMQQNTWWPIFNFKISSFLVHRKGTVDQKENLVLNNIRMMIFSGHPGWRFGLWRITQEKKLKRRFLALVFYETIFDFLSLLYIAINFVWDKLYHFLYVTFHLLLFNTLPPLFTLNFPILYKACFMSNFIRRKLFFGKNTIYLVKINV